MLESAELGHKILNMMCQRIEAAFKDCKPIPPNKPNGR